MSFNPGKKTDQRAPELMAPAGNLDAAYAAFHFGADAIYLGLQKFSARADAENFSLDDLDRITAYAHALMPRRKVFVALNTLILQSELKEAVGVIGDVADIGVDALIVQDFGVFRIAHRYFPSIRLHASTQMAIHNLEGALILQELGFHRVTLARELTMEEIREITRSLKIETEFFAHGALCYSYSGLCLISSLLMGRSGNRGRCAYLCRDRFREADNAAGSFLFSMRDLSTSEAMSELIRSGVASLKIEGRKKSPLYVAATVNYYRKLMDGLMSPSEKREFESDIQSIFSRPWTSLYLKSTSYSGVTDPSFVGPRGTPVGRVDAVVTRGRAHYLCFTTERPLERFDGLQLELEGQDKPYGFSVEDLAVYRPSGARPSRTFEARAGSRVEVRLPAHHPPIPLGTVVYCSSSQAVKRRYQYVKPKPNAFRIRRDIAVKLTLAPDGILAEAECEGIAVRHRLGATLNPARQPRQVEQAARDAFEKTGDTPFRRPSLLLINPDNLFVPISVLNATRRAIFDKMVLALREEKSRRLGEIVLMEAEMTPAPRQPLAMPEKWSIKISDPSCLALFEKSDPSALTEVVLDITHIPTSRLRNVLADLATKWGVERVRLGLPLITRSWERKNLLDNIALSRKQGFHRWEVANVSGWAWLRQATDHDIDEDVGCDWSVYVLNRAAARQVLDMGAHQFLFSPEDTRENVITLLKEFPNEAVVMLYQDTPLFISENCVRPTVAKSGRCPSPVRCHTQPITLVSSYGDRLQMETRQCRTIVTGESSLSWSLFLKELRGAGAKQFRVDLSWRTHTPESAWRIWRAARNGETIPGTHFGNFERGLL